jgi:1,2-phenylacetyl-CoA epoxidase catalytic subunit
MTQTALEWFVHQIGQFLEMDKSDAIKVIEQAKEMEKEQIKEAYAHGSNDRLKNRMIEYYNEKYGGEK